MSKPNILIVVIDSLRWDHVSCYGYGRTTTPNIDRLAEEGCLFETCIAAAPFSPASYASILSNLYPHQHGVNGDTVRIWPDTWPRLPELMKKQGYRTFCLSNNSFVSEAMNGARGFDVFADVREFDWFTRQRARVLGRVRKHAGEGLAKRLTSNRMHCMMKGDSFETAHRAVSLMTEDDGPVFGFVILMDPHTPYNRLRTEFCGATPAVRRFFRERNDRTMWAELMAEHSMLDHDEMAVVRDLYDAECKYADTCLGLMLDGLRAAGRLDNTIVAVASDHGEAFGERGVWGHGFCLDDCLTRVPLVVRHPDYWPAGIRCPGMVQLHDLHELCLSVAGTGSPRPERYAHCLTQASETAWPAREVAFSEFPRQSRTLEFMHGCNPEFAPGVWDYDMWSVRLSEWRFTDYGPAGCELYDLKSDSEDQDSVHDQHPDISGEMFAQIDAHRSGRQYEPASDGAGDEIDEAVAERLRALGYIE